MSITTMIYRPEFDVVDRDPILFATLSIDDDVSVGHNAKILPGVASIWRGAVIAADAIVTCAVSAYAIVAGNPAHVRRLRFSATVSDAINECRWWECDPAALRPVVRYHPDFSSQPENHLARD